MLDQKKLGHSTSTQTWVDMKCPNSWKKPFPNVPKNLKKYRVLNWKNVGPKKKLGHSTSTQTWVDMKCPNSWKKLIPNIPQNFKNIRAFYIHSNMNRHEIPKELKKIIWISPKFWKYRVSKFGYWLERCFLVFD